MKIVSPSKKAGGDAGAPKEIANPYRFTYNSTAHLTFRCRAIRYANRF